MTIFCEYCAHNNVLSYTIPLCFYINQYRCERVDPIENGENNRLYYNKSQRRMCYDGETAHAIEYEIKWKNEHT